MWPIVLISLGFLFGVGTGYKATHKKIVPFVKFVEKSEKERILKARGIRLTENTKCSICGDNIIIENIGVLVSAKDDNIFICSKPQCMTVSDILRPISKVTMR